MTGKDSSGQNESHASSTFTKGAFDIVALAAWASGLTALRRVLAALPTQFRAARAVAQTNSRLNSSTNHCRVLK